MAFWRFSGFAGLLLSMLTTCLGAAVAAAAPCPDAVPRCAPELFERRTLEAAPAAGRAPAIDGRLDDPAWAEAPVASRFIQSGPDPGAEAAMRTEARFLYDDRALYVAVRLYDPAPRTILAPFVRRDDETVSDWVFVEIDSRHDRRTGFSFGLNPRAVQVDGLWMNDVDYTDTWNAVWEGAARVDEEGWTAEYRIPFSQLAYSPADERDGETVWGVNIYRNSQRRGEVSNWSPRVAGLAGVVSHFNDLRLRVPAHQRRLEIAPYAASRWEQTPAAANAPLASGRALSAGGDVRLGLGSSFNLTGTVLPDFSQVEQDPSQVNLTALELFQTERRPFFVEGMEAFRFDTSLGFTTRGDSFAEEAPFYSRRIGHAPQGSTPEGRALVSLPSATAVVGAVKLAGRTSSGWSAGVFSAVTAREEAVLAVSVDDRLGDRWPVEPLTSTSVAHVTRDFQNGESSVGGFVSSTLRHTTSPATRDEFVGGAWTAGVEGRRRFAARQYEIRGWVLGSRLTGGSGAIAQVAGEPQHYFQRPDAGRLRLRAGATSLSGAAAETRVARIGSRFTWNLAVRAISPGFDINAAGFQRNANWVLAAGAWQYQQFRPGRAIRAWTVGSDNVGIGWSWLGEPRARAASAFGKLDFRNYWDAKMRIDRELPALSFEWLRGGPAVRLPTRDTLGVSMHTDQRRPTSLGVEATTSREPVSGSHGWSFAPALAVRTSDHLSWSLGSTFQRDVVGWQYAGATAAPAIDFFVARVEQRTAGITVRADAAISSHLVVQFYAQPFVTTGRRDNLQRLIAPRALDEASQFARAVAGTAEERLFAGGDTERSLNGNLVLRWEYRPGSFLTVVWNHHRDAFADIPSAALSRAFSSLWRDPGKNVVLVKTSVRLGA